MSIEKSFCFIYNNSDEICYIPSEFNTTALHEKVPRVRISLFLVSVKNTKREKQKMELDFKNSFEEMSQDEIEIVDGGSTKIAAGICTIGAGVCFIVSGVASWTGHDKVAAAAGVAGGACGTAAGVLAVIPAP